MPEARFDDPDLIGNIASDIPAALKKVGYFELLDDRLCPPDPVQPHGPCGHSFANTIHILRELGIELIDLQKVFGYLRSQGAHCDCEVLTKIAENSRFKTLCAKAN
jgi:hypothetical protein